MQKIKILITDPIDQAGIDLMQAEGFEVMQKSNLSKQELIKIVPEFNAVLCRTSTKIDQEIIAVAANLKCIGLVSTGWDHIDIEAASAHNIAVLGLPPSWTDIDVTTKGSFVPTAEHVILCMLALAGNFYPTVKSMKEGKWEKFGFSGTELFGKTLGIVGFGRIGKLVAERAQAFKMTILINDHKNQELAKQQWPEYFEFVGLEELCRRADFITLHLHKTPETINLITKPQFDSMKSSAMLINTARGAIVNSQDLYEALKNNKIRGAAIDVFEGGSANLDMDFISLPNVIATPHIAGVSQEGQKRQSLDTARSVIDFFQKGDMSNTINQISQS